MLIADKSMLAVYYFIYISHLKQLSRAFFEFIKKYSYLDIIGRGRREIDIV